MFSLPLALGTLLPDRRRLQTKRANRVRILEQAAGEAKGMLHLRLLRGGHCLNRRADEAVTSLTEMICITVFTLLL